MAELPTFSASQLEAVCKVLGATSDGLTGSEIGHSLRQIGVEDNSPTLTKWQRLYNALSAAQNKHQVGNHLVKFVNCAMAVERYASSPELFQDRRDSLNVALSFAGYGVNEKGQVIRVKPAQNLETAQDRAVSLKAKLEQRGTHQEIFKYCRAELVQNNYFHAVLEATKGLAERIRGMSGLVNDGADLVTQAFSTKSPLISISSLTTDTEVSEQKGISNLLIGVFGAVRNPLAHAPKAVWSMPLQDALDVLGILSYVHRKLDNATSWHGSI
jgi:uncharacterized protein (TIGR02391 family)